MLTAQEVFNRRNIFWRGRGVKSNNYFEGLIVGSVRWLNAECVCVTAGMLTAHHRRGLGATIVHRQSKTETRTVTSEIIGLRIIKANFKETYSVLLLLSFSWERPFHVFAPPARPPATVLKVALLGQDKKTDLTPAKLSLLEFFRLFWATFESADERLRRLPF